jgi:predicted SprT family Zn-dependent metalloprotease
MTSSERSSRHGAEPEQALTRAHHFLHEAFRAWDQPEAAAGVQVEFSPRMRSSLGRCYPDRRLIRLHQRLRSSDASPLLREVVCHEAAHIVAFERHGGEIRPHGPEWVRLVQAAEVPARTKIPCEVELSSDPPRSSGTVYEHRCPVCHATRHAKRPVPQWRCAACVEAGLPGALRITSQPSQALTGRSEVGL